MAPEEPIAKFVDVPSFPSILIDAHQDLLQTWAPARTLEVMERRADQAEEIAGELLLRISQRLGPEGTATLMGRIEVEHWPISIAADRLTAEGDRGLARRRQLGVVARDLDRCLGLVPPHPEAAASRAVLASALHRSAAAT
ncbi:MAG: hypothetical protein V3V08_11180 [Nannocystaceae bacterium]